MRTLRRLTAAAVSACLILSSVPATAQDGAAPAAAAQTGATGRPAPGRARNVILFLADAGGVPTLSAASLLGYGEPLRLHVQGWPHLGLSETSPVDDFVSDSANGMSAIVTGVKTRNGVISQGPDAVRGQTDGAPTKTLLEYAEERGLLTGVITTQAITDATPAANYAHANDRAKWGEIFPQAFTPRFGDGVDVLFGAGREEIAEQLAARGSGFDALSAAHGRPIYATLADAPADNLRPVVVADAMDVRAATLRALEILERSDTGYFLVVEWDAHTDDPRQGLQNVVDFDRLIAEVQSRVDLDDTLLLFTADHSFGLQVDGGRRGEPLLEGYDAWKTSGREEGLVRLENVLVNDSHTAEEVPVLAIGVGAERVRGYFPNTYLFKVMMDAWSWSADPTAVDQTATRSDGPRP
ncbi:MULTISPECIES: alkaline phosphatase [unclassified Brevundimonas]|jgi:alkaline phosphatase|uniref:alkaline phosphatase n=1 Tax=unclassified Brevundimonas TaxID=2622653 RepID=UPI0020063B92|nr:MULTISPECIES: alkaline phosphatase [unclassified Brevundimonas]MCK6105173.1 alkaline phosphatase [Brevundimonas sp. EYE_349]